MNKTENVALVKRMKFLRELLSEFGLKLSGYDPGVTAFLKSDPCLKGQGYAGEPIQFENQEWKWLEPLLIELRNYRNPGDMAEWSPICILCGDTATQTDGEDRPVCGDCLGDGPFPTTPNEPEK